MTYQIKCPTSPDKHEVAKGRRKTWAVNLRSPKIIWAGDGNKSKRRFFETQAEAQAFVDMVNHAQRNGGAVVDSYEKTIGAAIEMREAFLKQRVEAGDIAWHTYDVDLRDTVQWKEHFANMLPSDLLTSHIQQVVNPWTIKRKTAKRKLRALWHAFEKCREMKWVEPNAPNPVTGVVMFTNKHHKTEDEARRSVDKIQAYTHEQIKRVVETALKRDAEYNSRQSVRRQRKLKKYERDCSLIGHNGGPSIDPSEKFTQLASEGLAIYFAFKTGLRWGEQFALKWQDINFEDSAINIRVSIHKAECGVSVYEPKTKLAVRSVVLPDQLKAKLKEWRLLTKWAGDDDLIFPTRAGTIHQEAKNISRRFLKPACAEAGVDPIRWHDARHYHASFLLEEFGTDWIFIADQLGHYSADFTRRQYGHWVKKKKQSFKDDAARFSQASSF